MRIYSIRKIGLVLAVLFEFLVVDISPVFSEDLFKSLAGLKRLVGLYNDNTASKNKTKYRKKNNLDMIINKASRETGVDKSMIKSIIKSESNFQQFAISTKGARGYMQLLPKTARSLGVRNIYDPVENISGGTRYYKMMLDKFRGNRILALYAYNAGPTSVEKGRIPLESRRYAKKVMRHYWNLRRTEM